MRALVSGGAGFIGSQLAARLHAEKHDVLVIDDFSSGRARLELLADGVEVAELDIRSAEAAKAATDFAPDVVFHLAAQIDVRRSVADPVFDASVNIIGTLNLIEAVRGAPCRFVFTSSGGTIYGEVDESFLPVKESAPRLPTSPYGISKNAMQDYLRFYAQAHGLPFVILALANVFGPWQDPHGEAGVVAIFGKTLLEGKTCVIYGDGTQTRDFVFVSDVVDAFMAAAVSGDNELFNIGTATETSVLELYRNIARLCGTEAEPTMAPARTGELSRSALDYSKAKSALGWEPKTTLTDGLAATVEFLKTR